MGLRQSKVLYELEQDHLMFWCPGCKGNHSVTVNGKRNSMKATWAFDDNWEAPTFTPSIVVRTRHTKESEKPDFVCHSFIRAGVWEFLGDCTHALAGQKVPMEEIDP